MREGCFDELAKRAPGTTGEDDLGSVDGCVAQAADAALAAVRPAYRDVLLLRDVHGLDTPALAARGRHGRVGRRAPALPRPRGVRERLRDAAGDPTAAARVAARAAAPTAPSGSGCARRRMHALLHLGPLPVRERARADLRRALSAG